MLYKNLFQLYPDNFQNNYFLLSDKLEDIRYHNYNAKFSRHLYFVEWHFIDCGVDCLREALPGHALIFAGLTDNFNVGLLTHENRAKIISLSKI